MTKRILVALSGTPFTPSAIETALELGREHDAEVTGVTVIDVARLEDVGPVPLGGSAAALDLTEHRRHVTEERIEEQVSRFEAACAEQGTIHRVIRETGDAMEELMGLWRYHDVTVVGLRGLFDYGIFRDPHDKIIALLAKGVRPILAVAEKPRRVERVLIAYSGSMESAMAMKRFVQLHLWPNTTLGIAHFDRGDGATALARPHQGATPAERSRMGRRYDRARVERTPQARATDPRGHRARGDPRGGDPAVPFAVGGLEVRERRASGTAARQPAEASVGPPSARRVGMTRRRTERST